MIRGKFDLEERLIAFSCSALTFIGTLPRNQIGKYLTDQLARASVGAALNYGEAQAAESKRDFMHKMQIVLKELRESNIAMQIIERQGFGDKLMSARVLGESSELVAIFTSSIKTLKSKK